MDSYSGRFPLDFVFYYLGMTTEAQDTANILPDRNLDERTDTPIVEEINPSTETDPSTLQFFLVEWRHRREPCCVCRAYFAQPWGR